MNRKYLILTVLFLVISYSLLSAHTALLSKTISSITFPGSWYYEWTYHYDYIEEGDELILSSIEEQYLTDGEYGPATWIYNYHATHSAVTDESGTTYHYEVFDDSTNTFRYLFDYTLDSQGKLTKYNHLKSSGYSRRIAKSFNQSTELLECLVNSDGYINNSYFSHKKYIFSPDSLGRLNRIDHYVSNDSINWQYSSRSIAQLGNQLPYSLNFELYESYHEIVTPYNLLLNCGFQIDVLSFYNVAANDTTEFVYNYTFYPEYMFLYIWDGGENFKFNTDGRLLHISVRGENYANSTSYVWGEYTSNDDDIAIPVNLTAYPNPFRDNLSIKLESIKAPADISIYNIKGQLIRSWKGIRADELTWDGEDNANNSVSSGIYIIKARQCEDSSVLKVIKY